jgi:glycosyltransferase involved in cell wall biosynthesis
MEPLVSILIPTYNRLHYFNQALMSALNQTYENIEIIICDNSEDSATEKLVEILTPHYKTSIKYHHNPENIGHIRNLRKCFDLAEGDYINYLMDDDLLHPQKIEKMMNYFLTEKDLSLVTSHRLTIDEKGCLAAPMRDTKKIFKSDKIIDGKELAGILIKYRLNYVGEPSTVLFKKDSLDEPFGTYSGRQAIFAFDVAAWLNLLEKGKAVYISQSLSYFRIHKSQMGKCPDSMADSRTDWKENRKLWRERHGWRNPQ